MMPRCFARLALRAGALRILAGRYLLYWRQAWSVRALLDAGSLRRDEAEFLPGALALQKMPPSPAPRVAIALLTTFALLAVLWAVVGRIDIVATAPGKIVPSGRSKPVQAIETASIKAIHVREGDAVHAGTPLLELDATIPAADADRLEGEWVAARLQALRARALLRSQDGGQLAVLSGPGLPDERIREATRQAEGMLAEYRARQARLEADIDRRESELRSTLEQVRKLERTLPMASRRAQDLKELNDGGFVSRHAWMEKEQARLEQEGELATLQSRMSEIRAALRESLGQRETLIAETRRQLLDAAAEGDQKAEALQQEWLKARARQRLMDIRAPIDGTVQQLAVNTIGGVVTPAQVLMLLVPNRQPVEVDAVLENKDVGFVRPGQAVELKIEAFPHTRFGTVPATVVHVSPDAVSDDNRGLAYLVKIRLERTTMVVEGKTLPLHPGMAVVAEIRTGRRRVIEYFLSPLLEHTSASLRER